MWQTRDASTAHQATRGTCGRIAPDLGKPLRTDNNG